jgi:iron complex outermembrane receptor protein
MNKPYGILLFFLLLTNLATAQGLRGRVTDAVNGQAIAGATISAGANRGTTTNASGEYRLDLPAGSYSIQISFVGYQTQTQQVTLSAGEPTTLDAALEEAASTLQEIAVVGSRSATARSNVDTPVPVDVISARELRSGAQTDVTQILNFVAPSFSSNRQTVADGTDHIDPASLRGLGPDQVLVLINGKRRHTTALVNINGTFGRGTVGTDLNAIPVAAIERIEVLRDGAAAQYGSDAIAGVINIVLKRDTPWNVSAYYGQSVSSTLGRSFSDGKTTQIDLSKGFKIGEKGFVHVGAQYLDRGQTNRGGLDTRPLLYSAVWPATPAGQDPVTYRQGLKAADDARAQAAGLDRNNMRVGNAAVRNLGAMANGAFGVGAGEVYFQTGYTKKNGEAAGFYRLPSQTTQIDLTIYPDGFLPLINTDVTDFSFSAGGRGTLGGWRYDLSSTNGLNQIRFDITNTVNASLPLGTSPTEFYAGTLRFSQNVVNLDVAKKHTLGSVLTSLNTAFGAEYRIDRYQIEAGEELSYSFGQPSANIPGRLVGSSFTAAGSQVFPGFKPSNEVNASRSNLGFYADFEGEFGPRVLLGLAGRYENYSDFGSNFSYKATGRVNLLRDVALRGAIATGFRAPSLHQRFFNNESTQFVNSVPRQVLTVNNDNPVVRQFGVGSLQPELSQSYSLGLTAKAGTLTLTVDAYQIDIRDRIVFSSQFVREGATSTSQVINGILDTVDPNRQINSVQFFTNAIDTRTRGLDVVLAERLRFNRRNTLTLTAAANFNETRVLNVDAPGAIEGNPSLVNSLFDRQERSRFESSVPRSKLNLSANYVAGKLTLFARTVRFGSVTYLNPTLPGTLVSGVPFPAENDQTFSPKWITDLTASYEVAQGLTATVGVNNLFDIYPDRAYFNPRNVATNFSADPTQSYTGSLDNTSNGRFLYSRAVSQFGFNGRFVFGKLALTF